MDIENTSVKVRLSVHSDVTLLVNFRRIPTM